MNRYQVTYHLNNGEKLSKNIEADDPRELQSDLILNLDVGTPVSIKTNVDSIFLIPASAIMYFEIKEL